MENLKESLETSPEEKQKDQILEDNNIENITENAAENETENITENIPENETENIPENETEIIPENVAENETDTIIENSPEVSEDTPSESVDIKNEDANTTNCLALTIQEDHKLTAIKNVFFRSIRMSWKVAVSTITLALIKLFS